MDLDEFKDFIQGFELDEHSKLHLIQSYASRTKKRKLTPYNIFMRDERVRITESRPGDVMTNKEVLSLISDRWKITKLDDVLYNELVEQCARENKYQVSTPFHKYSLYNRHVLRVGNEQITEESLTEILKNGWDILTKTEKQKWDL